MAGPTGLALGTKRARIPFLATLPPSLTPSAGAQCPCVPHLSTSNPRTLSCKSFPGSSSVSSWCSSQGFAFVFIDLCKAPGSPFLQLPRSPWPAALSSGSPPSPQSVGKLLQSLRCRAEQFYSETATRILLCFHTI